MVLVDTSVWMRSFAGREPFLRELKRLLSIAEVAGHNLVYGELMISDFGARKKVLSDYEILFQAPKAPHSDVVAFVAGRSLQGRGVGWIDVHLLASAIVSGLKLWTVDPRLSAIANEFGVEYRLAN
jgi:predicted nucleic acid-binding protein